MIFGDLASFKWNHLYESGAYCDQDPMLNDRFRRIHSAIADEEAKERRKQEAESKNRSRGVNRRRP